MLLGTVPIFEDPNYNLLWLFFAGIAVMFVVLAVIHWIQSRLKDRRGRKS